MKRAYWFLASCLFVQTSYAGLFYQQIKLEQNFVSASNAEIVTEPNIQYWKALDTTQPAEVLYKFNVPTKIDWALLWSNSVVSSTELADYLYFMASPDAVNWKIIDSGLIGKKFKNFVKDAGATLGNSGNFYIRGVFSGESARFLQNDRTGSYPFIDLQYSTEHAPEPSSFVMIYAILCYLSTKRIRS